MATLSYLAAAYTETGDFEKVTATQREVIELTPSEQRIDVEERQKSFTRAGIRFTASDWWAGLALQVAPTLVALRSAPAAR